jgi:transposase
LSVFPHLTLIIEAESENKNRSEPMQVIHERCAALDVHKKTVVTTMMLTQADGSVQEYTRTCLTMTADLLALDDWLDSHEIKVIAMESTGVFTPPIMLPKRC